MSPASNASERDHVVDNEGKFIAHRTGVKLCEEHNAGKICDTTVVSGASRFSRDYNLVHQCNLCFGLYVPTAEGCNGKTSSNTLVARVSQGFTKGKGKGKIVSWLIVTTTRGVCANMRSDDSVWIIACPLQDARKTSFCLFPLKRLSSVASQYFACLKTTCISSIRSKAILQNFIEIVAAFSQLGGTLLHIAVASDASDRNFADE